MLLHSDLKSILQMKLNMTMIIWITLNVQLIHKQTRMKIGLIGYWINLWLKMMFQFGNNQEHFNLNFRWFSWVAFMQPTDFIVPCNMDKPCNFKQIFYILYSNVPYKYFIIFWAEGSFRTLKSVRPSVSEGQCWNSRYQVLQYPMQVTVRCNRCLRW